MFTDDELLIIRDLCLASYKDDVLDDFNYALLDIADKIDDELGLSEIE